MPDKVFSWKEYITYICPNCGSGYDYSEKGDYECEICGSALYPVEDHNSD